MRDIRFLQEAREMLLISTGLYSWQMDGEFRLQYTNHPNGGFCYDLFKISTCDEKIRTHFAAKDSPIIVSDDLGFCWMVAADRQEQQSIEYHLLGPFFTVEATEYYIMRLCDHLHISSNLAEQMRKEMKQVPTVQASSALSYAVMLQYYTIGEKITRDEVVCCITTGRSEDTALWQTNAQHNTWEAELNLFDAIKNGTLNLEGQALTNSFSGGAIGTLCPGDPLRQSKDEAIVLIVLASRAAILGGVSPEGGYALADYFFQRVEACQTIGHVQNCCFEILHSVMQRVKQCKQRQHYSATVSGCMDYIETHLFEKINLEQMAKQLGYASYYLSKRFKQETGKTVNDYIKEEKIERAKLLFTRGDLTVNEASERLAFSSPSYFCAVFKQYTGMLPSEFVSMSQAAKGETERKST